MFYEIETSQLVKLLLLALPAHALWILFSQRWHPLYLLAVVLLVLAPFSIAVDSAPVIVALKYARAYTGFLLLGAGVVMVVAQGSRPGKATWAWIAFSLYYWFAATWSDRPFEAIVDRFRFILLLGGGIVLGLTLKSLHDFRSALRVLFFGSLSWSALIIVGIVDGHFQGGRLSMFGMNPNQIAIGCGFTFLVSLTIALHDRRFGLRALAYASCGVIGLGAVLTGSRAGVGSLVVGVLPIVAAVVRRPGTFVMFALASVAVGYFASGYIVSDVAFERLGSSENTRRAVWAYALDLAAEAPILGRGSSPDTWKHGKIVSFDPHSIYLHVLLTIGTLGLLFFLAVVAATAAQHVRAWRILTTIGSRETWPIWFSLGLLIAPLGVGVFESVPITGVSIYTLSLGMSIGLVDAIAALRLIDTAQSPSGFVEVPSHLVAADAEGHAFAVGMSDY